MKGVHTAYYLVHSLGGGHDFHDLTMRIPAKVAGKIVLCDRGVTARVNKSLAVVLGVVIVITIAVTVF